MVAGLAAGEELKWAVPRRIEGQVTAIGPMRLLPLYGAKRPEGGVCEQGVNVHECHVNKCFQQ